MSTSTLTAVATLDPVPGGDRAAVLHDRLTTADLEYDALVRAAQAALAADARNMPNPLGWLRDALAPGQLPPPGARPTDFVPGDPRDAVWGRW